MNNILTYALFESTNTREFREWFEGSKVVDGRGRPLLVYHGSPEPEDLKTLKHPLFFCKDKKVAEYFGKNIVKAHLSIKNPILFNDDGSESWSYTSLEGIKNITDQQRFEVVKYVQEKYKYKRKFKSLRDFYENRGSSELYINDVADLAMKNWKDEFDGIIARNIYEGDDDRFFTDDYVPFRADQIRQVLDSPPPD